MGARRGPNVKLFGTPGATQLCDTHKITLALGSGKQQPHLDQFAIVERPDWANCSRWFGPDLMWLWVGAEFVNAVRSVSLWRDTIFLKFNAVTGNKTPQIYCTLINRSSPLFFFFPSLQNPVIEVRVSLGSEISNLKCSFEPCTFHLQQSLNSNILFPQSNHRGS